VAAIGALFLAVSFLHVRDSHYATNDVPSVALAVVSVWLALRGYAQPRWQTFVLAGLFGGLATSAKYATEVGLLPKADLTGIYDLSLLNDVLRNTGRPEVRDL
jgi:NitT/TauT family transport system substrate-binding protein